MSADDESSQTAGFSNTFATISATSNHSFITKDIAKSLFDPDSAWDFAATPGLESFNLATSTFTSTSQAECLPQTWGYSGFENQTVTSSVFLQFATVSASITPTNLFAPSSDPNCFAAPSEDGHATDTSSSHPPAVQPRFCTSLALTVEPKLRNVAMPGGPRRRVRASIPDPSRSETKAGVISSPGEGADSKHESRKRYVSSEAEDKGDGDDNKPAKKTTHNMTEKRYRSNMNDNFAALRDSVPSLRILSKSARGEDTTQDCKELYGLTPAHKLNKATVLSKATEYIRHLEKRNYRLLEEKNAMRARVVAFEEMLMQAQ